MNLHGVAAHPILRNTRRAGPLAWVWVTVAAALLSFGSMLWIQARQDRLIVHLTNVEILLRQARVDLTRGYLHIVLGGRPGSPFDRAQGLARLGQAYASLEKAARLHHALDLKYELDFPDNDHQSQLAAFARAVVQFRGQVVDSPEDLQADVARLTGLRIAFFSLEQQAEQVDARIQQHLAGIIRMYGRQRMAVMAGTGLLLLVICLGALASHRARRQAGAALRASDERLRLALEAARMGTFDYDLQAQRITWTQLHEELWGFRPGEFDGSFAAFAARVHPDDLPGVQAELDRCRKARAPYAREFRVVWPDSSVHWISCHGQFDHDSAGRAARFRGAALEITARKREDDLRRENDERFRNLILRSPVPTGILDSDGTVSLINESGTRLNLL